MVAKFISNIEYSSDMEWSRYLIFNIICGGIMVIYNIVQYIVVILHFILVQNKPNLI